MADGGGSRAVLMTVVAAVAFAAGAATVCLVREPAAHPSEPPAAAPAQRPDAADAEKLRAAYDKIADAQKDLQSRIVQLNSDLDEARARLAEALSSKASDKWEPTPTDKPAMAESDGTACVVQAVDNKSGVYVISEGSKDGVEKGMEFVVRRGAETIGSIVIDKVFPNYASGCRKPGSAEFALAAGDVCTRAPSGK
jgi:hypothetical protein